MTYLNDEQDRGANRGKGALTRAATGRFIGIENGSYIILKKNGNVAHMHSVRPLDEAVLVRRGIPAGGLRHVRDAANASDYLTKFVDAKKTKFCDDYATNRSSAVKIRTTP